MALTRAQHHAVVWWANIKANAASPLSHLLFARDASGTIDPALFGQTTVAAPTDDEVIERLAPLANTPHTAIEVTGHAGLSHGPITPLCRRPSHNPGPLGARRTRSPPDRLGERWSFTLITNRQASALEEHGLTADEPVQQLLGDGRASTEPFESSDLVWGEVPGSAAFGTLVHQIFERVDFSSAALESEVQALVADQGRSTTWPADDAIIVAGIVNAITTPLGAPFGDIALTGSRSAPPTRRTRF
ncbi:MAG: hypothetical protein R2706_13580 [Acidimicrobiales bacterium]